MPAAADTPPMTFPAHSRCRRRSGWAAAGCRRVQSDQVARDHVPRRWAAQDVDADAAVARNHVATSDPDRVARCPVDVNPDRVARPGATAAARTDEVAGDDVAARLRPADHDSHDVAGYQVAGVGRGPADGVARAGADILDIKARASLIRTPTCWPRCRSVLNVRDAVPWHRCRSGCPAPCWPTRSGRRCRHRPWRCPR